MPEQDDPDRPTPLEYRDGRDDIQSSTSVLIGTAFTATVGFSVVAWVVIVLTNTLRFETGSAFVYVLPLGLATAALAGSFLLRRSHPALGAGLLVGIGLAVLLVGGCFALVV